MQMQFDGSDLRETQIDPHFGELLARWLIIIVRMPFHLDFIGIAALLQTSIVEFATEVGYPVARELARLFACL